MIPEDLTVHGAVQGALAERGVVEVDDVTWQEMNSAALIAFQEHMHARSTRNTESRTVNAYWKALKAAASMIPAPHAAREPAHAPRAAHAANVDHLSPYELVRLANMGKNHDELRSLGLA